MDAKTEYLRQQLNGATVAEIHIILIGKAIISLNGAIEAIHASDFEARFNHNKYVYDIISVLAHYLDQCGVEELADVLGKFYKFALTLLMRIDVENDPEIAKQMIEMLVQQQRAWQEVIQQNKVSSSNTTTHPSISPSNGLDKEKNPLSTFISA